MTDLTSKKTPSQERKPWTTPRLAYRGSVAEILKSGNGKLSITLADSGEMRCEKPHTTECVPF